MDLNQFIESSLLEDDDYQDQKATDSGSSLGDQSARKTVGYNRMYSILLGQEKFEGSIEKPEEFRAILDAIKKGDVKFPAKIKSLVKDVERAISKIEKGSKISEKEEEIADEFADLVEDELFQMTYMKKFTAQSEGGSGGLANKARFSNSIPVKYTTDAGKDYYGLLTPPTGFIAWQSQDIYKIAKNDPDIVFPPRFEMIKDNWTVVKNKSNKIVLEHPRFKIKENNEAKRQVEEAFKKHGAEINAKGELPGIEKVVKKVEFWKDIAEIF